MTRKTAKPVVALMVLTLLLSVLAGCGGGNNNGNKNTAENTGAKATNSGNATATAEATAAAEDLSPLTLSFFAEDPNPNWNNMKDEVSTVITQRPASPSMPNSLSVIRSRRLPSLQRAGIIPTLSRLKATLVSWWMPARSLI